MHSNWFMFQRKNLPQIHEVVLVVDLPTLHVFLSKSLNIHVSWTWVRKQHNLVLNVSTA